KAAAEVFATPHGVPGVRLFDLRAGAPVHFDAREVRVIDLLKLLKRKARPAFYLGSGMTWDGFPPLDDEVIAGCFQKLCAPEPEALCTAKESAGTKWLKCLRDTPAACGEFPDYRGEAEAAKKRPR